MQMMELPRSARGKRYVRPGSPGTDVSCLTSIFFFSSRPVLSLLSSSQSPPPPRLDPILRFCFAKNMYPPEKPSEHCKIDSFLEPEGCNWRAYCKITGFWEEQGDTPEATLFQGFGYHYNFMRSGLVRVYDLSQVLAPSSPNEMEKSDVLRYIASGDCSGPWNPGHCIVDLINLSLVQRILEYDEPNTIAYLMRGLNYDRLSGQEGAKGKPFWATCETLAGKGNVIVRDEAPEHYPKDIDTPVGGVVAFSPPPPVSIWWGHGICRGLYSSEVRFRKQMREPPLRRYISSTTTQQIASFSIPTPTATLPQRSFKTFDKESKSTWIPKLRRSGALFSLRARR